MQACKVPAPTAEEALVGVWRAGRERLCGDVQDCENRRRDWSRSPSHKKWNLILPDVDCCNGRGKETEMRTGKFT